MTGKNQLVIMVKEPRPGRVKTRLARDIGKVEAAWWFRHQVFSLIRRLNDPRWQITLAVSPDDEGLRSRVWPPAYGRIAQGRGDLGERMRRVFERAPEGNCLIIGADIPGIDKPHISRAFSLLGSEKGVIGPAVDGGYWAIGLSLGSRNFGRRFLRNVRWSSEHALADTVKSSKIRFAFSDTLSDVDAVADLLSAIQKHKGAR